MIQLKDGCTLDHIDKINIFYAKGWYKPNKGSIDKDLAILYNRSCDLPDTEFRRYIDILNMVTRTWCKLDLGEYRSCEFFRTIFTDFVNTIKILETTTPEKIVNRMLANIQGIQVNKDGKDIIGLGNPEDNATLLDFIKKRIIK